MRGEVCKYSWEMYELIDGLQEHYSIENYGDNTPNRINDFINEVRGEINEYGGDRKDRIQRYFIECIQDLLREKD